MPVRVSGYDQTGCNWHDVAQTVDVSRIGVALRMARRVRHGMVLHLTLPLPTRMRSHGYADQNYSVYAVVRRMGSPLGRARIVGLEFLGENPPTGYLDEPWATFQTANWSGPDRRREPREPNSDAVIIDFLNESMQPIGHELGTTENVSPSGMRVYVKVAIPQCDFVKVTDLKSDSEKVAAVRNQYVGQDGFERLCLQFVQAS